MALGSRQALSEPGTLWSAGYSTFGRVLLVLQTAQKRCPVQWRWEADKLYPNLVLSGRPGIPPSAAYSSYCRQHKRGVLCNGAGKQTSSIRTWYSLVGRVFHLRPRTPRTADSTKEVSCAMALGSRQALSEPGTLWSAGYS